MLLVGPALVAGYQTLLLHNYRTLDNTMGGYFEISSKEVCCLTIRNWHKYLGYREWHLANFTNVVTTIIVYFSVTKAT